MATGTYLYYFRMLTKTITSPQHPLIKHLVKLRSSKEYRTKERHVLVAGKKLVHELGQERPLRRLIVSTDAALTSKAQEVIAIPPELFKKVTGLVNPECVAAEIEMPQESDLSKKSYILALDQVADPGNLGTLQRTALALGWDGLFLVDNCTDPFNDKALRAAKGASFYLPFAKGSHQDLLDFIEKNGHHAYLAEAQGKPIDTVPPTKPMILILGNEAHGISSPLKERGQSLSIPINPQMESLNVAIAGAILMYALKRP